MNKARGWIVFLLLIGLAYRLLYIWRSNLPPVIFDATAYDELARNLLSKGFFEIAGKPFAFYTPGYPFFLTAVYWLFGVSNYKAVYLIQALLSTVNLWLGYRLVRQWWGDKVALVSLGLMTIYSPFIYANGMVLTEVWYSSWLLLWLNHWSLIIERNSGWTSWWLNGMLWGIVLTIRPATALFIPGQIILGLLGRKTPALNWHLPKLRYLIAMLIGAIILLSPWTVRNYQIFHKLIPFSAESGNVFLLGTYVGYKHEPDYPNWPIGKNEVETDSLKIRYGINRIKNNLRQKPFSYSWWYISKFKYFWFWPYSEGKQWLPKYEQQQIIHKVLVWMAFGGMYWLLKKRDRMAWLMVYLLSYLTLIHMAFMTLDRLAFPTMYIVLGFSAVGIVQLYDRSKGPMSKIDWRKQLSLGGILAGLVLFVGLLALANSRGNHYSLLQWFAPSMATILVILRKFGLVAVSLLLAYSVLKTFKLKLWPLMGLLGAIFYISSQFSLLTDPGLILKKDEEAFRVPISDSVTYQKIIDIPKHLASEANWNLKLKLGRDFRGRANQGLVRVLINDEKIAEIRADKVQEFDWQEFQIGRIEDSWIRVKVTSSGLSEDNQIYLWGKNWKNYGLSLTPEGQIKPGSYEIGLSRKETGLSQIPIWYGSSNYEIRSRLLNLK